MDTGTDDRALWVLYHAVTDAEWKVLEAADRYSLWADAPEAAMLREIVQRARFPENIAVDVVDELYTIAHVGWDLYIEARAHSRKRAGFRFKRSLGAVCVAVFVVLLGAAACPRYSCS